MNSMFYVIFILKDSIIIIIILNPDVHISNTT